VVEIRHPTESGACLLFLAWWPSAEVGRKGNHHHEFSGKSVVLVYGGFVDGAGWKSVYDILKRDGYDVAVVQNPSRRRVR
jgi:hypothetical protein